MGNQYNPALFDQTGTAWPAGSAGVHPNDAGELDEAQMIYAELVNPVSTGGGGCASHCTFSGATTLSSSGGATIPLNVTSDDGVVGVLNSTQSGGPFMEFTGSGADVDTWVMGSAGDSTSSGGKAFLLGDLSTGIFSWKSTAASSGAGYNEYPSLNVQCWSSTASITTSACDLGLSRTGPGTAALGNGTAGDSSASLSLSTVTANFYKGPATAPSGACTTIGWAFSQDGHATFCNGSTWVTKL